MVVFRHLSPEDREVVKARQIIHTVARAHGFDLGALRLPNKRPDLSRARRAAAAAAYRQTAVPVSEIARILNRNHSTIREGLRVMGVVI